MKIFLSHSSRNKPLLREIKRYFPDHINSWLDEKSLFIGQNISLMLKDAIEAKSDFVVIFVDNYSIKSEWVKKELQWALDIEKKINRAFILPIVLEKEAWELIEPREFAERKHLTCFDYDE